MSLRPVADTVPAAVEAGLKLLDRRALTATQMREHLRDQGFDSDAVADAVAVFVERGWLDDSSYADVLLSEKVSRPGVSRAKIVANMQKRGLEAAVIAETLEAYERERPNWEQDNAITFLRSRAAGLYAKVDPGIPAELSKLRAKLWRYLASRGFPSEMCTQVVRQVLDELETLGGEYGASAE